MMDDDSGCGESHADHEYFDVEEGWDVSSGTDHSDHEHVWPSSSSSSSSASSHDSGSSILPRPPPPEIELWGTGSPPSSPHRKLPLPSAIVPGLTKARSTEEIIDELFAEAMSSTCERGNDTESDENEDIDYLRIDDTPHEKFAEFLLETTSTAAAQPLHDIRFSPEKNQSMRNTRDTARIRSYEEIAIGQDAPNDKSVGQSPTSVGDNGINTHSSDITVKNKNYVSPKPKTPSTPNTASTTVTTDTAPSDDNMKLRIYNRILAICVVYVLPFSYKSSSQLPYVFFLLELVENYDIDLKLAGAFLAMAFICRLTTLAYCIKTPRKAAILGTLAALTGYVLMAITSQVQKRLSDASRVPPIFFVAGNIMVGFGEINGVLQIFVKENYSTADVTSLETVSLYLKGQLSIMRISTIAAYAGGGLLYDYFEVTGVSIFGACLLVLQLSSLVLVYHLEKKTGRTKKLLMKSKAIDAASAAIERSQSMVLRASMAAAANRAGGFDPAAIAAAREFLDSDSSSSSGNFLGFLQEKMKHEQDDSSDSGQIASIVPQMELGTIQESEQGESDEDDSASVETPVEVPETRALTMRKASKASDAIYGSPVRSSRSTSPTPMRDRSCSLLQRSRSLLSFRIRSRISRSPSAIIGSFSASEDVPIRWINYFVAFSVSFQSILNGFIFGTGTLLMFEEYGLSKSLIGVIYSCSAVSGVVASMLPLNTTFTSLVKNWFPAPHNFYMFLFACTYMTILTALPFFAAYLVGFFSINMALGLFVSYLTELQGKISTTKHYQKLAPYSQMARRLSGLGIMLVTPTLYDVLPRLPNIIGSCACFLFTLTIYIGFEKAKDQSRIFLRQRLGSQNVHRDGNNLYVTTVPGVSASRRISFSEQIIMTSVLLSGQTLSDYKSWKDDSTLEMQVNYARRESMVEHNVS